MDEPAGVGQIAQVFVDTMTEPTSAEDALRRKQRHCEAVARHVANAERELDADVADGGAEHNRRAAVIEQELTDAETHAAAGERCLSVMNQSQVYLGAYALLKGIDNRLKKLMAADGKTGGGQIALQSLPLAVAVYREIIGLRAPQTFRFVLRLLARDIEEANEALVNRKRGREKGPERKRQAAVVFAAVEWMVHRGEPKTITGACNKFAGEVSALPKGDDLRALFADDTALIDGGPFRTLYYEGRKAAGGT